MALAHTVGNKVECRISSRGLFEKRRRLMAEWATYCNTPKAAKRNAVIPLREMPLSLPQTQNS